MKNIKKSLKFLSCILVILLLTACGSTAKLSNDGQRVAIVKKEPLHCKELGRYYGAGTQQKYALNNLRNIVGEKGGNYVYIVNATEIRGKGSTFVVGNDHRIDGYGFRCKTAKK